MPIKIAEVTNVEEEIHITLICPYCYNDQYVISYGERIWTGKEMCTKCEKAYIIKIDNI